MSNSNPKLYIVATPIGNLGDLTLRAIETLKNVNAVLCEDTRRTVQLMNHLGIKKRLIAYHRHSTALKTKEISDLLEAGSDLALVSDSGTPGIADPGNKLIEELLVSLPDLEIIPIPGASAIAAICSVAGINMDKFTFLGFPPQKKGRETFFRNLKTIEVPIILYESPHRLLKTLTSISTNMPDSFVVVGKEITKAFEKIYRGKAGDVLERVTKDGPRGEYTIVINPSN